jgi:hypothetical protein
MKILQFGADVEVLEPDESRQEVKEEIGKMTRSWLIADCRPQRATILPPYHPHLVNYEIKKK